MVGIMDPSQMGRFRPIGHFGLSLITVRRAITRTIASKKIASGKGVLRRLD